MNAATEAQAPGTAPDNNLSAEEREALVLDNQGLVYKIAGKYYLNAINQEDIIQESHWILAYMGRAARQGFNVIRIPEYLRYNNRSQNISDRTKNQAEMSKRVVYLDDTVYDDGDPGSLHEVIPDTGAPSPEEAAGRLEALQKVLEAMAGLSWRDRFIIRWLYFEGATLQVIGDELGLTRERVRQLKEIALTELRGALGG